MEPYDADCRGEVLAACDTNDERRLIALRFKVSPSWLRLIQQQRRETGQVAPKKSRASSAQVTGLGRLAGRENRCSPRHLLA